MIHSPREFCEAVNAFVSSILAVHLPESETIIEPKGIEASRKIKEILKQVRRRGGAGGSRRPFCLSVGEAGGAKVPFLNAMICFLIVNMIQRRSYKLKTSNI